MIRVLLTFLIIGNLAAAEQQVDGTYAASYRNAKNDTQSESSYGTGARLRYSWFSFPGYGFSVHAHKESSSEVAGYGLAGWRFRSGNFTFDLNFGLTWGSYAVGPAMAPAIGYRISSKVVLSLIFPSRFYDAPIARAQVAPYLGVVF